MSANPGLGTRLRQEITDLGRIADRVAALLAKAASTGDPDFLDVAALNSHVFYTGASHRSGRPSPELRLSQSLPAPAHRPGVGCIAVVGLSMMSWSWGASLASQPVTDKRAGSPDAVVRDDSRPRPRAESRLRVIRDLTLVDLRDTTLDPNAFPPDYTGVELNLHWGDLPPRRAYVLADIERGTTRPEWPARPRLDIVATVCVSPGKEPGDSIDVGIAKVTEPWQAESLDGYSIPAHDLVGTSTLIGPDAYGVEGIVSVDLTGIYEALIASDSYGFMLVPTPGPMISCNFLSSRSDRPPVIVLDSDWLATLSLPFAIGSVTGTQGS